MATKLKVGDVLYERVRTKWSPSIEWGWRKHIVTKVGRKWFGIGTCTKYHVDTLKSECGNWQLYSSKEQFEIEEREDNLRIAIRKACDWCGGRLPKLREPDLQAILAILNKDQS